MPTVAPMLQALVGGTTKKSIFMNSIITKYIFLVEKSLLMLATTLPELAVDLIVPVAISRSQVEKSMPTPTKVQPM